MKKILLVMAAIAALALIAFYLSSLSGITTSVLYENCSPARIKYDDFSPYCLGVIESTHIWGKDCKITIVNAGNTLPHGYGYRTDPVNGACDKVISTEWKKDGVTINFKDGPVTIEKQKFIGGR